MKLITYRILLFFAVAAIPLQTSANKTEATIRGWEECYTQHVKNLHNSSLYRSALHDAATLRQKNGPADAACNSFLYLIDRLIQDGEYIAAMQIVQRMQSDGGSVGLGNDEKRIFAAECENRIGLCYSRLGATDRAMEYFNSSHKRIESMNVPLLESKIINNIGEIHYRRGSIKSAIELQQQALNIILPHKDSTVISAYNNNLGILYMKDKRFDKAREHFGMAVRFHRMKDYSFLSYIYTNMAELSEAEKNYTRAEKELAAAIKLQEGKALNENILATKIEIANIYIKTGRLKVFKSIKDRLSAELRAISSADYRAEGMRRLSELCFAAGDTITGARLLLDADRIRDSLRNNINEYQLQQMLVAYDTERLQSNNLLLKQSLEQLRLKARNRNLTIAICLALLALFAALISMLARKNKAARLIHRQRERLHKYEQKEHERKEKHLRDTIDVNNRRLTEYAIDQSAVNEFQQLICKKIEGVINGDYPNKNDAAKVLEEIVHEIKRQKDSQLGEDFHTYFEQVNPDFLRKIKLMFPQITQNDIRLCAYLYLGLSTKEIAALTYREVRSIETSRLRLRKKLGLKPGASLHDFLVSVNS